MKDYTYLVKKCEWCGKDFRNEKNLYPYQFYALKMCSNSCLHTFRKKYAEERSVKKLKSQKKDYTSLTKPCKYCGKEIKNKKNLSPSEFKDSSSYCSSECKTKFQSEFTTKMNSKRVYNPRKKDYRQLSTLCPICGKLFYNEKNLYPSVFKTKSYCSTECKNTAISKRMKKNNPMKNEESLLKMMTTSAEKRSSGEILPTTMSKKAKEFLSYRMKENNPNKGGIYTKKIFFEKVSDEGLNGLKLLTKDFETFYEKERQWECQSCGRSFFSPLDKPYQSIKCPFCKDSRGTTEKEIADWISQYTTPLVCDRKIIAPLELDVVIPEKKLAIEVDEIAWHSEINPTTYEFLRGKNYHIRKTLSCKEKGYTLLHVWDVEWEEKKEIVKSLILGKLSIFDKKLFARKCQIKELNRKKVNFFLKENHMQGEVASGNIFLGLFYQEELVSALVIGSSRFKKEQKEIIRYCNKLNTSVVGGLSKLWKYYLRNYYKEGEEVVSYADLRYFDGASLKNLGFKFLHNSDPNYKYWKFGCNNVLFNRMSFQKHKLKEKLEFFDSNLSEWENMKKNKYNRIWDCGNAVYIFKRPK